MGKRLNLSEFSKRLEVTVCERSSHACRDAWASESRIYVEPCRIPDMAGNCSASANRNHLGVNPAQLNAIRHAVDGQHVSGDAIVDVMLLAKSHHPGKGVDHNMFH